MVKAQKSSKRSTKAKKTSKPTYWFAAKKYGWGWSVPLTWQGWLAYGAVAVTFAVYTFWVLHGAGNSSIDGAFVTAGYCIVAAITLPVLFVVCLAKGEPLRWRWGSKKK